LRFLACHGKQQRCGLKIKWNALNVSAADWYLWTTLLSTSPLSDRQQTFWNQKASLVIFLVPLVFFERGIPSHLFYLGRKRVPSLHILHRLGLPSSRAWQVFRRTDHSLCITYIERMHTSLYTVNDPFSLACRLVCIDRFESCKRHFKH
jgi:hypothetical protein